MLQFIQTDVLPRRRENDGASGEGFERVPVDRDALFRRFVDEVDAENHAVRVGKVTDLQSKNQAPFQTAGIAHADDGVGHFQQEKLPCGLLLGGMAGEGIDARQVGHADSAVPGGKRAFRAADGFSRPVSGVLMHAGECVEDGAFSDVRVPGEGGGDGARLHHISSSRRTVTMAASVRRRAMTAPRMR